MKGKTVTPFAASCAIAAVILGGMTGCASFSRCMKSINSDISGGLDRTVTLYDYQGDVLGSWSGKFDISEDDNEIYFDDADGKRVIIQGGVVVCEEN